MALSDDFNRLIRQLEQAGVPTRRFREEMERAQRAGEGMDEVVKNMEARLETANRSMRGFTSSASSLNGILKANLAELSKSNSAINDGKKGYRQLTSIVSRLSDIEDGITQAQVKQLRSLNEKAQISLKEVKSAANRLVVQRGLHRLDREQLTNSADRLLAAGRITAEEAALLKAKASNFEFETKAAAEAQHRLNLEKNINSQLGLTGAALSTVGKLASQIGLTKFGDELENITEKLQNDMRVKTRQAAEDQLASSNQEYKLAKRTVDTLQDKLDKGEELTDEERQRLNTSLETLETYEDQVKKLQEQIRAAGSLGLKLKAIGQAAAEFGKQLTDPLFILGAMVKSYMRLDKAAVDFQRITGQNARALAGQNDALITSVETLEKMAALSEELGFNVNGIFSPQQMGDLTYSAKALGLSAEQATNLGKRLTGNVGNVKDFEKLVDRGADKFTLSTGKAVNLGQVLRGVSSTSDAIALSLGQNPELLGEAVAGAQALGMSLSKVDQIADSLMDFESSIQNELEAQLLTGGQIALGKARELALNNDLAGLTKEIANNNALSENFAQANRIQQESMAKALGMSRDELAKMIIVQKANSKLSADQIAEQMKMTPEMVKQITAQEKLNSAVAKLGESLAPFIDALVPLIDLITPVITSISSMAAKVSQVGVDIRNSFDGLADSEGYKSVAKLIGTVTGGAIAFSIGKRMLLGTRLNPMIVRDADGGLGNLTNQLSGKKGVLGKLTSFITGKGMRSGAQTKGITRLMNAFRGGGMRGGGKALMRMGGGTLAKAASAATSVGMTGKGLYDFFSSDKMRSTGVGGFMESLGGTGMKILDFATFGLTKKLTEMANITIPGMDTDDIADARAIFHSSGRDPDNSRMPIRTDNYQLISDILNNQQAYPDHIVAAAKKVNPEDIKPVELALGGIVTKATNAIVGEAGSEAVIPLREFYAKMDELINVVKQGGDVYIDGNRVGESLMLASTKLS